MGLFKINFSIVFLTTFWLASLKEAMPFPKQSQSPNNNNSNSKKGNGMFNIGNVAMAIRPESFQPKLLISLNKPLLKEQLYKALFKEPGNWLKLGKLAKNRAGSVLRLLLQKQNPIG